jgi:glycine/D-amino acid oxidase-like deaminating enzyme
LKDYPARLTIDTNTPVTAVSYLEGSNSKYPYLVDTPRGSVRAANVIYCTNGHTGHLVPGLRGKMYPRRGTMSVQAPGPSFPDMSKKQSWSFYYTPEHNMTNHEVETGRYYSFQHHETGDLWLGGDKDYIDGFISSDDTKIDSSSERNLPTMTPKLFNNKWIPKKAETRRIWSGIMCYTPDQVPLIGKLPACATGRVGQGEWIAGGWNTYGMTNGLICGDTLGKIVLGETLAEWFPKSYLITEARLAGGQFQLNAVAKEYFERIGAHEVARSML